MNRPASHAAHSAQLIRAIRFFETIEPESVQQVAALYAPQAEFCDPFNNVTGADKVAAIFADMFVQLDEPRFTVINAFESGPDAFVTWDFTFRFKRFSPNVEQRIHGATHLTFTTNQTIARHRDYWDAAHELYAKLPVVGALIRLLRKRASAHG